MQVAWVSGPWFLSIFVNMLPWESGETNVVAFSISFRFRTYSSGVVRLTQNLSETVILVVCFDFSSPNLGCGSI